MSKYNLIDIYEQYQIGSGWTNDFDYDGMLKTGLGTSIDTPIEVLKKMSDDFEDVNYHRENSHLQYAIDALEIGDMKEAESRLNDFHAEIKQTIKDQGMDIEPTVGKFMASKMEEGEKKELPKSIADKERAEIEKDAKKASGMMKEDDVEEVTSRDGSRIEGLLSIPLKAKFLEAFQDLYFDLVEEDPFMAEDVVDHLGIEMLKHLDAIQAQGDKLAGVNTDDDFEREQRMQMGMREEDSVDEAIFGPVKFLKSKGIDDDVIKDFMKMHSKDIVGASEDEIMDEFEQFRSVNYDYVDENLKEHFGRFMKDYQ